METVGKNSAVFITHLSKVLWYINISMKYQNFCVENMISLPRAVNVQLIFFACADKNDVMVTCFSKMAVLLFTKGSFLYYEHQVWFNLKFRGKIYFVIIFMSKLRGPVHGLSYLQVSCAFGVLHIYFKLYLIWMTDNK